MARVGATSRQPVGQVVAGKKKPTDGAAGADAEEGEEGYAGDISSALFAFFFIFFSLLFPRSAEENSRKLVSPRWLGRIRNELGEIKKTGVQIIKNKKKRR